MIQKLDVNINDENFNFFKNHREIFERIEREEELSINDSSAYSTPYFIMSYPNEHAKRRRERKSSPNAKYNIS